MEIYREDYAGEAKELTGATSCFVVAGTDEDFVYTPIRTSSATISVLDSDLLLDLYSINNQYAPVKLYKNGVLEWTGYIKPEQFTQPYVPSVERVGVECVCALATLENITYEAQTTTGYITMGALLKYLISAAAGGYKGVYIPMVYGSAGAVSEVWNDIELCEENFTSGEMNLYEVMEAVCKFFNWTVYDLHGYLYFVDADFKGTYRLYDEALNAYTNAGINEINVQALGVFGTDANTLDIVPGYNKASVKSVNNVFDDVIKEEPYDILEVIQTWEYNEGNFEDARRAIRRFKKPMFWEMFYYDHNLKPLTLEQIKSLDINSDVVGGVEVSENGYRVKEQSGEWIPKETDFDWEDLIKCRLSYNGMAKDDTYKAFSVKGVNSVWKDGAFGLKMEIRYTSGNDMVDTANTVVDTYLYFVLRIGSNYWNGSEWVDSYSTFRVRHNVSTAQGFQPIKSNKNANMPYRGLSGHVIELPTDRILKGELEFIMFLNDPADSTISGYFIKNFELDYVKKDGVNDEGENGDRVYENVVNEKYMNDYEGMEFEIGSYNQDGATYSKALLGGDFLTDNLFCAIVNKNIRPEELMIRRIVNRYGVTKIKLTEGLRESDLVTPLNRFTERTQPGKTFRLTSGEWDYEQGRVVIQIQEDAE